MPVTHPANPEPLTWRLPTDIEGPILALDTTDEVTLAVVDAAGVLASAANSEPRRHVESLVPMIRDALDRAGIAMADLAGIAAGTGPAPYTGLRIGLVTALTLGRAADKPVWGVSGLDAIAAGCARQWGDRGPAASAGQTAPVEPTQPGSAALTGPLDVIAVADAKRREVFWARYRFQPGANATDWAVPIEGPGVCAPGDLAAHTELTDQVVLAGPATDLCRELAGQARLTDPAPVPSAALALIAAHRHLAGLDQQARPIYLRHPDVQVPGGRKRATA